jgi:hypothetical protein
VASRPVPIRRASADLIFLRRLHADEPQRSSLSDAASCSSTPRRPVVALGIIRRSKSLFAAIGASATSIVATGTGTQRFDMLSLGERLVAEDAALRIVRVWLETAFEGGRHVARIAKLDAIGAE